MSGFINDMKFSDKEDKSRKISDYFTEFCNSTSLHGFRYIGEQSRNILERILWVLIMLISVGFSAYFISKIYTKWDNSPVIVTLSTVPVGISEIPFPAVTICPVTQVRQTLFNFTDVFNRNKEGNVTSEEKKNLEDLSLVCPFTRMSSGSDTIGSEFFDTLNRVKLDISELITNCRWNTLVVCKDMFSLIITEAGVCYTFNMLNKTELFTNETVYTFDNITKEENLDRRWSIEKGYPPSEDVDEVYPRRTPVPGAHAGLRIYLKDKDKDLDYICGGPMQGYKIILHQPGEIPRADLEYFLAPLNEAITVTVKPEMMTTSENLRPYKPEQRKCYFSTEKPLKFFKLYSQKHCEIECVTSIVEENCGCVAFYMPRSLQTPICGKAKKWCILKTISTFSLHRSNYSAKNNSKCHCLPSCHSLSYSVETSQTALDVQRVEAAVERKRGELSNSHFTILEIFYKNPNFITSERRELYGVTDFVASCGGICGLFMGFSFVSLVEIFYHMTVRLWCNKRTRGKFFE